MAQLSESQISIIEQRLASGGITDQRLQHDLTDHFCCFIEEALDNGADFETAYEIAMQFVAPNGVQEIQEEQSFLLTTQKQIPMKRALYGSGFLTAFFISVGITFKLLHWPKASAILLTGFAFLIITALTMFIGALKHFNIYSGSYKFRIVVGILSALAVATGHIFKMLHYPGANVMILLGMAMLSCLFLPVFFYHLYKQSIAGA